MFYNKVYRVREIGIRYAGSDLVVIMKMTPLLLLTFLLAL